MAEGTQLTSAERFDLFLSYNHADRQVVSEIRERLAARGVRAFIDQNDLNAGKSWLTDLERALENSRAVAVFVGRFGYGPWQHREAAYAVELQTMKGELAVIPVILEGAELPTGFIALNTWVDLRSGIDDASIESIVRAIDVSQSGAAPPTDISPYRRLDAFREEDTALFFGRKDSIGSIVRRIDETNGWEDRPRFVTVTGPSGSGKSSVVAAGVLPRLRSRRPPGLVWDAVVMQPRKSPWDALSSALLPLLEPTLAETDRNAASGKLAEALCAPKGISSTIERILEKSRGTDRLLVVVDQFEELFTQTGESMAREFIRALLDASRNAPLCVLATLRSDYYGKAIALDRRLSDALPSGQVNLGPMRRGELREVIVSPAKLFRLTFDDGLVNRMLDDVGHEPGNLPLLEYALSELWDLRTEGRLTFAAYQEIGGVAGALTRRAETIYGELSDVQQKAARRLLMRLVRVSPADEEGADTRRRARRDEIGEEDWKLVHAFAGERARLVVSGKDPASGEDGVEVVHEALIRRWARLREWLNDDREFLLWRQDLSLYRAGSPEGIPQGALLAKASKWLHDRGGELNAAEREYVEKSVHAAARTRLRRMSLVAAAVVVVLLASGWITYTRTTTYDVQTILGKNPEAHFARFNRYGDLYETNLARATTLIRLGRYDEIREGIAAETDHGKRARQLARLAVALSIVESDRAGGVLKEAVAAAKQANWTPDRRAGLLAEVAKAALRLGDHKTAIELLQATDELLRYTNETARGRVWCCTEVAEVWELAGRPDHARQVLRTVFSFPASGKDNHGFLRYAVEALIRLGEIDVARKLPELVDGDARTRSSYELARVTAYAAAGDPEKAKELASHLHKDDRNTALTNIARLDFARHRDPSRAMESIRATEVPDDELMDNVIGELILQKRDGEVEPLIAGIKYEPSRVRSRTMHVQHLIGLGRLDEAARVAERLKYDDPSNPPPLPFAHLGVAFARAGKRTEAENALRYAMSRTAALLNEHERDEVDAVRASAEAILGRFHEARRIADGIEQDDLQWDAYFAILDIYVTEKKRS